MSALAGRSIRSFYCEHIELSDATEGITSYLLGGVTYTAYVTEISFGTTMYARAYTEDMKSAAQDMADHLLIEGRLYGAAVTDSNGTGITEESTEEDIRLIEKHCFSAIKDGVTTFEGAVLDAVMPTVIEHIASGRERIVYGGSSYILSYTEQGGRKTNIRLVREEP